MTLDELFAAARAMPSIAGKPPPDVEGEPIEAFMERSFRPGGADGTTRFQAVSRVAGHYARQVALGKMTPEQAKAALLAWKKEHIEGDYPDGKAVRALSTFIRNDAADGSNAPPGQEAWAAVMVSQIRDGWRYCEELGGWHWWSGFVWRPDRTGEAIDLARRTVSELAAGHMDKPRDYWKMTSAGTIAGVERLARSDRRVALFPEEFDADPLVLNTPGGVVDLKTGEVRTATRDDYFTRTAGAALSSGGCPLWLEFLKRVTDGDDALIRYLQAWFGYSLTGLVREAVVNFWYGSGANGKSVALGVLSGIAGDYAASFPSSVLMASRHERHPEEVARLRGIRCAITSEVDSAARFDEAKFKLFTGGDKLTARYMRQNTFEFEPQFSITIAGNHRPHLSNVDEAMRRRLHLIPFEVTIPPEQRDKALGAKLKAEWGGVLAWAIEGAVEYMRAARLPALDRISAATEDWFQSEDRVAQWIADRCEVDPTTRDAIASLYASFETWCRENGERFIMTKRAFAADLKGKGYRECDAGKAKGLLGLRARGQVGGIGP